MTSTDFPATHLTTKFTEAVAYASALHATQIRKGTHVPYIAHLLGVASLVLEAEGRWPWQRRDDADSLA